MPISASLGFAQVDVVLKAGEAMQWEWSILEGENVLFTIHSDEPYHVYEVRNAAHSVGSFEAPADGSYALYWEREAADRLTLRYRIAGDGHLDPTRAPVPP